MFLSFLLSESTESTLTGIVKISKQICGTKLCCEKQRLSREEIEQRDVERFSQHVRFSRDSRSADVCSSGSFVGA